MHKRSLINIALGLLLASSAIAQPDTQEEVPLWKQKYDSAQLIVKTNTTLSLRLLMEAEKIALSDLGLYDENYLTILNDLALAYADNNQLKKAKDCLVKTLSLQKEVHETNDPRYLLTECNLASVYLRGGQDAKAKALYGEVLRNSQEGTEASFIAFENTVLLFENADQLDSALSVVRQAYLSHSKNLTGKLELQLLKCRILRKSNRTSEADIILDSLMSEVSLLPSSVTQSFQHRINVEKSLNEIGSGLYVQAERDLLSLYRSVKSEPVVDEILLTELINGLAFTYEKLGIFDKALLYYHESLSRCVKRYGISARGCTVLQNNIATIYLRQGLFAQAIASYEELLSMFQNNGASNSRLELIALNNLASAYRQNGDYEKSLERIRQVLLRVKEKKMENGDLAAAALNNLGVTLTLQGKFEEAVSNFKLSLAIKEKLYGASSISLLDVVSDLAVAQWALRRYDEAIPLFRRSRELALHTVLYIFPTLTESEQVQFYQEQKQNFERFSTLAVTRYKSNPELLVDLFNHQLLLKSIVFFTTKKRNTLLEEKNNTHLKALAASLQEKSILLGRYYQLPLEQLRQQGISLTNKEHEIDSLEKVMRHAIKDDDAVVSRLAWKDIQGSLHHDEALVEIIRFRKYDVLRANAAAIQSKQYAIGFTDSIGYVGLITTAETHAAPTMVWLKNGNDLEQRNWRYYRNTLRFDISDTISWHQYWEPFMASLSAKKKVYLSADGVYHKINLNALRDPSGKFIIEKFDLFPVMNSSQIVKNSARTKVDFTNIVLFGNPSFSTSQADALNDRAGSTQLYSPLPGTKAEIEGIMDVLKLNSSLSHIFMRQAASENNLRKVVSPSILHIATHGFFSSSLVYVNDQAKNNFLFQSGIVLAPNYGKNSGPDGDNDGVVTAYDVMNLPLQRTELVVLSACETGLGKIENGEGVFGLQRSFLQAGAGNIMVSLWKVDDAMTKDLMIRFYTYLAQDYSCHNAFRQAQLDRLNEAKNPRQWAGFVLVSGN